MKNIVIFDEYNELDLKPSELLEQYIQMTEEDVQSLLVKSPSLKECSCPGCGASKAQEAFKKLGMQFKECLECQTLYVSPRPDEETLSYYYNESPSRKFWQEKLFKATEQKRKEKIFKPRCEWILDSTQEFLSGAKHWVDVHTSQYGYIDEMLETPFFEKKTLLNPYLNGENIKSDSTVSVLRDKGWGAKLENQVDVVSLFEVLDHTSDVENIFENIGKMLKPSGLCFITAILSSGFDIQVLWGRSESLYPPDRLNVFSVEGLKKLFERCGFECIEFSTPGILDLEIVEKVANDNPDFELSRFTRGLINNKDENVKRAFQEFLQVNLLSSYGRILIRKKDN
ncbi:MAG: methyltransferase domain-containing protein [Candidatus Omnitrophica bacterium]|nr:methyltransferase domain-containing protein [Candidatus Omnitrophota bacterium]